MAVSNTDLQTGTYQTGTHQTGTYKPSSLSPSSASTFRNCNRRWKFKYVDRLPDPPGEPALIGSFVHKVLEDLLGLPAAERTIEAARQICTSNWPATAADPDFVALKYGKPEAADFKRKAWQYIEKYFQTHQPQQVDVIEREQRLKVEIGKVPFLGFVDLLERAEDGIRVTDYKTGKPPKPAFVDDALAQVWLYAAALVEIGNDITSVQLAYLSNGNDKRGALLVRLMDENAMHQAVARHTETWDAIHGCLGSNDFSPNPGPLCGWCPYREHCPEGQTQYAQRNRGGNANSNRL